MRLKVATPNLAHCTQKQKVIRKVRPDGILRPKLVNGDAPNAPPQSEDREGKKSYFRRLPLDGMESEGMKEKYSSNFTNF